MKVVNLFGGPGTGKSTLAAEIFAFLKKEGVNCELITEYAKDRIWEDSLKTLDDQIYVFGKQHHKQFRCRDHVDILITDSPILLSIIYDKSNSTTFRSLVVEAFNNYNNINYLLDYKVYFSQVGRMQNEEQSRNIHNQITTILNSYRIPFKTLNLPPRMNVICDQIRAISDMKWQGVKM